MIEAALRAGIPSEEVAAEIEANIDAFTHCADRARAAGTAVVPDPRRSTPQQAGLAKVSLPGAVDGYWLAVPFKRFMRRYHVRITHLSRGTGS